MKESLNTPLVSIIVPVYNGEKHIAQCIQSLREQSLINIEIIVINDGSTDSTERLVSEQASQDSRIHLISQPNKGVSYARNEGIKHTSAPYLTFVDSDDMLPYDAIEFMYSQAEENKADLVSGGLEVIYTSDNKYMISYPESIKQFQQEELVELFIKTINYPYDLFHGYRGAGGRLYKRRIIEQNNITFKANQKIGEDFIFVLRYIIASTKIIFLNKIAYIINRKTESTTNGFIENYYEKTVSATEDAIKILSPYFGSVSKKDDFVRLNLIFNSIIEESKLSDRKGIRRPYTYRCNSIRKLCNLAKSLSVPYLKILCSPIKLKKRIFLSLIKLNLYRLIATIGYITR